MKITKITSIAAAVALMASTAGYADTFDPTTTQLSIPTITIGANTYTNVVITVGSVVSVGSINGVSTTPTAANYSGSWAGIYGGYAFTFVISQTGNNLALTLNSTILPAGQTSTGVINGNTINVTTNNYATSGISTLTVLNSTTISAVQNSCVPKPGYVCLVPNGTAITFTKI